MPAVPQDIIARVIEDSARRRGGSRDACRIILARAVTWRDGSLGCPEPGRAYTMALVSGYWIVVEADGVQFDYRVNQLGHFRLCTHPRSGGPLPDDAI